MTYFSSSHYFMFYTCRYKACATNVAQALALRSCRSTLSFYKAKRPTISGGAFCFVRSLTMTYFHMGNPHYHWRGVVSLSCSGWEGVGPTRYGRQTNW